LTVPAVAEPVTETETPTLVTQESPPVDDATPPGDADPQASSDAAPSTPETTVDLSAIEAEAAAAYQEEMASKGSEQQAPEPKQAQGVDAAQAAQAIALHRQNYGTRQTRVDAYKAELLDQGLAEPYVNRLVKEFKDILNEEHGDGFNYAGAGAALNERTAIAQAIASVVPESVRNKAIEGLKPKEGEPNPPPAKVFEAFMHAYAEDKAAKAEEDAFKRGFRRGRGVGERTQSSKSSGQSVQGDPAGGARLYSQMTPEQRRGLTPEQRDAAVARERQARGG
jgi:hypothetical protein